jgi:thiamine monophosphate synthase
VPVVAIGGVTPQRVGELKEAGAYGVAVLGGVWRAADPTAAVIEYVAELRAQYDLAPLEEKHA